MRRARPRAAKRLSEEEQAQVYSLAVEAKMTQNEIAMRFGVSPSYVSTIIKRRMQALER